MTVLWVLDLENGMLFVNTVRPDGTLHRSTGTLKKLP